MLEERLLLVREPGFKSGSLVAHSSARPPKSYGIMPYTSIRGAAAYCARSSSHEDTPEKPDAADPASTKAAAEKVSRGKTGVRQSPPRALRRPVRVRYRGGPPPPVWLPIP